MLKPWRAERYDNETVKGSGFLVAHPTIAIPISKLHETRDVLPFSLERLEALDGLFGRPRDSIEVPYHLDSGMKPLLCVALFAGRRLDLDPDPSVSTQ